MNLIPRNTTSLERNLDETTARLGAVNLAAVSALWDPDTISAELLPWLAWAEGVDEWSSLWSEALQRSVIKAQREIRRTRGTKQSVVDAVRALSGAATISEWWEQNPRGTPHHFDITIAGSAGYVEAELQASMIRAIERSKPQRSSYTLGVGINAVGSLNIAGVARVATFVRMKFQG